VQLRLLVAVRDVGVHRAPAPAIPQRAVAGHRAVAGVEDVAERRGEIVAGAAGQRAPVTQAAVGSLDPGRAVGLLVVRAVRRGQSAADERRAADRVREVALDHVHDAAQRIRAVEYARGAANDLDPLGVGGLDVGRMLVTPALALDALSVVEHEHATRAQAPDDRLPDRRALVDAVHPREPPDRLAERWGLRDTQLVVIEDARRLG